MIYMERCTVATVRRMAEAVKDLVVVGEDCGKTGAVVYSIAPANNMRRPLYAKGAREAVAILRGVALGADTEALTTKTPR